MNILILVLIHILRRDLSLCSVSLRGAVDDAMIILVMTNKMLPRSGNLLVDHDEFVENIIDGDDMDDFDEVFKILGAVGSTGMVLTPTMLVLTSTMMVLIYDDYNIYMMMVLIFAN